MHRFSCSAQPLNQYIKQIQTSGRLSGVQGSVWPAESSPTSPLCSFTFPFIRFIQTFTDSLIRLRLTLHRKHTEAQICKYNRAEPHVFFSLRLPCARHSLGEGKKPLKNKEKQIELERIWTLLALVQYFLENVITFIQTLALVVCFEFCSPIKR